LPLLHVGAVLNGNSSTASSVNSEIIERNNGSILLFLICHFKNRFTAQNTRPTGHKWNAAISISPQFVVYWNMLSLNQYTTTVIVAVL